MRLTWRVSAMAVALCLLLVLPGCATTRQGPRPPLSKWGMRALGGIASFALHEGCHLVLGAALGADIGASFKGAQLDLQFSNLSASGHKAVAAIGNACTGLAAEFILWRKLQKRSDFAWGMTAYHSVNAFAYAFRDGGDREHWESNGGSLSGWQAFHATHAGLVGLRLAHSEGLFGKGLFGKEISWPWRKQSGDPPYPPELGAPPDLAGPAQPSPAITGLAHLDGNGGGGTYCALRWPRPDPLCLLPPVGEARLPR